MQDIKDLPQKITDKAYNLCCPCQDVTTSNNYCIPVKCDYCYGVKARKFVALTFSKNRKFGLFH